jgi:hypothetical protein
MTPMIIASTPRAILCAAIDAVTHSNFPAGSHLNFISDADWFIGLMNKGQTERRETQYTGSGGSRLKNADKWHELDMAFARLQLSESATRYDRAEPRLFGLYLQAQVAAGRQHAVVRGMSA